MFSGVILQAELISPEILTPEDILQMLRAWQGENKSTKLEPNLEAFSENIYSLTEGHPGLVGFCCSQLTSFAGSRGGLVLDKWDLYSIARLPTNLRAWPTYDRILFDTGDLSHAALTLLEKVTHVYLPATHPQVLGGSAILISVYPYMAYKKVKDRLNTEVAI